MRKSPTLRFGVTLKRTGSALLMVGLVAVLALALLISTVSSTRVAYADGADSSEALFAGAVAATVEGDLDSAVAVFGERADRALISLADSETQAAAFAADKAAVGVTGEASISFVRGEAVADASLLTNDVTGLSASGLATRKATASTADRGLLVSEECNNCSAQTMASANAALSYSAAATVDSNRNMTLTGAPRDSTASWMSDLAVTFSDLQYGKTWAVPYAFVLLALGAAIIVIVKDRKFSFAFCFNGTTHKELRLEG